MTQIKTFPVDGYKVKMSDEILNMEDGNIFSVVEPSNGISSILLNSGVWVVLNDNQEFQDKPKSITLVEKYPDGRIFKIKRWNKTSIVFVKTR